ncbi:lipopolysaccharide biosynthesis protein [Halothiobacillus sp.]|uniref:lipopolysaccharide biosynthesis protein n=1 Tax=Halothiobacillus sp. TaxID=1891311 RepID=UPI002AD39F05|nr:oligosaccharide flippase family protein [Halothiobacillus sp.]
MKEFIKRALPKNRFARSVSVLAGGTAAGQIIIVAASPILTRLYSPEDFGLLAVFAGLLAILGVIASLRYQMAIPLPESNEEATDVMALSLLVVAGMTGVTALIVAVFGESIAATLNTPQLSPYLWLLPVGLLLAGIYQVLNYWAIRRKAFSVIARTKVSQSAWMSLVQMGGYALGPFALLLGRVIGQAAGSVSLWNHAREPGGFKLGSLLPHKGIGQVAYRYSHFPAYSSWAGLLNTGGAQVPPIFFAAFFGPAAAGAYMLAQRVINLPMAVVATAVADAFLPNSVEAYREDRLGNEVRRLFIVLAILVFPSAAVLFIVAPELFAFVFGEDWRQAGEMVRWLTPMLAIQFIINPLSRIFVVIERQRLAMLLQGFLFLMRSGALVIAYLLDFSVLEAVKLFSALSAVGYLVYSVVIMKLSKLDFGSLVVGFASPIVMVFLLFGVYLFMQSVIEEKNVRIFSMFVLSTLSLPFYWGVELRFGFLNRIS